MVRCLALILVLHFSSDGTRGLLVNAGHLQCLKLTFCSIEILLLISDASFQETSCFENFFGKFPVYFQLVTGNLAVTGN